MTHLETLLPQRNLHFTRNVLGMGGGYLLALLLLVLAGALAWWQAPGLLRDQHIRSTPLELEDYDLRDGRCTTRKAVFTDCEADVAYTVDGVDYETHISLMFLSTSRGDYETSLIVAADDPGLATLSIGLERFWNRLVFFLVVFGALFVGGIVCIVTAARNARINRASRQPQRWSAELVEIRAVQSSFGGTLVTYAHGPGAGRRAPKANTRFRKRETPLLIESADGASYAIALRPAAGGTPLMLDAALQRVDLTETERAAAFSALEALEVTPA